MLQLLSQKNSLEGSLSYFENTRFCTLSRGWVDKYESKIRSFCSETNLVCGLQFETFLQETELLEYSGAYKVLKIDEIVSILHVSA